MVYIPNPTDATQPTGNVDASTADDEFRALKAYVLGLALTAGMFATVRQTANDGFVNATGDPAFLTAAAAGGNALDFKGTGRPLVVNFAGGSTGTGVNDRNSTLTADAAGAISAIPPSNTSFIYADYVNAAAMTWGQTLAPVQYGKIYPQTIGSILQFAGAAGTTTFLDDFGNTWAAQGGARVQTNQFKFGTGGLGGAGAANVLNGAADYVKCASFTTQFNGSWSARAWAFPTVLPGVGTDAIILNIANATAFGITVSINNNGGTIRFKYFLSSTGAATDIAGTVGTSLPVINNWYFVEVTYDAVAGVYRFYVNGVQEASTASALKVCAVTSAAYGALVNGTNLFTGYIDKPEFLSYCQHPAGTAYAVPTAAPNIATVGYAPDAFDFQAMKMYSVTGPSIAAGIPPATTQKYRCYLGEVDTGVVIPATIRSYAFNGKAVTTPVAMNAAQTTHNHNLGVVPQKSRFVIIPKTTDASGFNPNNEVDPGFAEPAAANAGGGSYGHTRNQSFTNFSTVSLPLITSVGGILASIAYASYNGKFYVERGW